jgi:hypothetical protein
VEAGYIPPAIKDLEPPTLTVFLHKKNTQIAAYFKKKLKALVYTAIFFFMLDKLLGLNFEEPIFNDTII